MIAESVICLARDFSRDAVGGGSLHGLDDGELLIDRLEAKAGLTFTLENEAGIAKRENLAP